MIVTKVGARRGADASWNPAFSAEDLTRAVHDNLRNLGVDALDVVNLRLMFDVHGPAEGSIEAPLTVLAELQRQGLIRRIGLSNATPRQVAEGRRIAEIVCVQNQYNLAHRGDDAFIDELAASGIAYVPFFPLGGFSPLQSDDPVGGGGRARREPDAGGARVAAAPGAQHPADPGDLFRSATCARTSRRRSFACRKRPWRLWIGSVRRERRSSNPQPHPRGSRIARASKVPSRSRASPGAHL